MRSCRRASLVDNFEELGAMGSRRVALAAAEACFQSTEASRLLFRVFSILSLRSDY